MASFLLAASGPLLRGYTGIPGIARWPLSAAALVMVLLMVALRRDARAFGVSLLMSVSAIGLGAALGFLLNAVLRDRSLSYSLAGKWALIGGFFSVWFGLRLQHLAATGLRPPSLWDAFVGSREEKRQPLEGDHTEEDAVAQNPSEETLRRDFEQFLKETQERLEETRSFARETKVLGFLMLCISLPLVLINGQKVLGVSWWALILPLLALGFAAFRLGAWIGDRLWQHQFGDIEEILKRLKAAEGRTDLDSAKEA